MAFCVKCGAVLQKDARFCNRCGAPRVQDASEKEQAEAVTSMVFGRIMAGLSLGNGIVGLLFAFSFGVLAAGFMDARLSMAVAATIFALQPCLAFVFAALAKKRGCTNKMARTGMILAGVALVVYVISIIVLYAKL